MTGHDSSGNFTRVPNKIMDALITLSQGAQELRLLLLIIRKTYGFNRARVGLSLSQMARETGINRIRCCKLLASLKRENLITRTTGTAGLKEYSLDLQGLSEKTTVVEKDSCQKRQQTLSKKTITVVEKDNLYKERERKKKETSEVQKTSDDALRLSRILFTEILKNNPAVRLHNMTEGQRAQTIERWAKDIDLLIRKDRQEPSIVEEVIRYCTADSFWGSNILSGKQFRSKWDTLSAQMHKRGVSNPEASRLRPQAADVSAEEAVIDPATGNPARVLMVRKTRMSVREEFKAGLLR